MAVFPGEKKLADSGRPPIISSFLGGRKPSVWQISRFPIVFSGAPLPKKLVIEIVVGCLFFFRARPKPAILDPRKIAQAKKKLVASFLGAEKTNLSERSGN